jgi:hypothetical protein
MRSTVRATIFGWFLFAIWCAPAAADGGSLLWSGKRGGYRITVFTAPTPFRAGAVDISTLVQDASTGDLITPVPVTVRMTNSGRWNLEQPATSETATNKLLQAAQFELPEPGRWALEVEVQGSHGLAVIGCDLDAAEPSQRWPEMWPWIGWPAIAIALFGLHEILVRRTSIRAEAHAVHEGP